MKRALLILVMALGVCGATFTSTSGPFDLYKGSSKVGSAPTLAACQALALAKAVTATYTCRNSSTLKVTADPPTPPPPVVPPPPPVMHAGNPFDPSALMPPAAGRGTDLLAPADGPPNFNGSDGAFRTVCGAAKMDTVDAVVMPGMVGAAHLHTFYGNTSVDAFSTGVSLLAAGNSTCRGGTINRSSYWTTTMLDGLVPIKPLAMIGYYKTGFIVKPAAIKPPPVGLKLVAGDPTRTVGAPGPAYFKCDGEGAMAWSLATLKCDPGHVIWQVVDFPQCWDGKNLDSPDHRSHMAYDSNDYWQIGGCPATHPVVLPHITLQFQYLVPPTGFKTWKLSCDLGEPGACNHADEILAWKPDIAAIWTQKCLVETRDCFAHLLGDGRQMEEFDGN